MAAGQGFKTFATGDVLTAADTNGYLMQGVLVFANATARDAAITSPQEGQTCYLKDTDQIYTYSGSAWVSQAGISASIVDAKGDLIVGSAADTAARLAVGTDGYYLKANSSATNGVEWASVSGGGMTLISEQTPTGVTSLSFSSISSSYKDLLLVWQNIGHSTNQGSKFGLRLNNDSTADIYAMLGVEKQGGGLTTFYNSYSSLGTDAQSAFGENCSAGQYGARGYAIIRNYASTTKLKSVTLSWNYFNYGGGGSGAMGYMSTNALYNSTSAITSVDIVRLTGSSTLETGSNSYIRLYGVS